MTLLLFGSVGLTEILLILLIILLLFGAKKIPELMRSMGKGVKSFKDGLEGKDEPGKAETTSGDPKDAAEK